MKCEEVKRLIDLYVAGELAKETCVAITEHLKTCPSCTDEEATALRLSDNLNKVFQDINPPPGLASRIIGAFYPVRNHPESIRGNGGKDRLSYRRNVVAALSTAAVLLIGLATWFILTSTKPGSIPPESKLLKNIPPKEYTFPDGSYALIAPDAVWEVKESESKILLQQGNLYINIITKKDRAFEIITPAGTVTVYGTEFLVTVDNPKEISESDFSKVSVLVLNGKVGLSNPLGKVIGYHGESIYAEEGSPPKKQSH